MKSLREDSSAIELYAVRSKEKTHPARISAPNAKVNTNRREGNNRKEQE
jgi:hypothetical protein